LGFLFFTTTVSTTSSSSSLELYSINYITKITFFLHLWKYKIILKISKKILYFLFKINF
jgi:hypothetical protein